MISKILTGQLPMTPSNKEETEKQGAEIDKAHAHRMIRIMSMGGVVLFLGLVIEIAGKKYLHDDLLNMIGRLIMLTGTFIMGYGLFSAMWRSTNRHGQLTAKQGETQRELDNRGEAKRLAEPMLSITERTTELIESSDRKDTNKDVRVERRA
jgi:uncharacterized protein YacL